MSTGLSRRGLLAGVIFVVLFALMPYIGLHVPWILPGSVDIVNSTGTLEVLGLCFMFAGVALGYDVMFGFTGLLSLGPVLYFAAGVYSFDVAMTKWGWALIPSIALTFAVSLVLAVVLGAIALRVSGIAFTMVTLAFAQAFFYLIEDNPHGLTGGESGLALYSTRLPSLLSGAVSNTRNLYWFALGFLVVTYAIVWLVTESETGHLFVAIRENERRIEVLGVRPFRYKLASYVLSSLIASAGGVVYLLLIGTALPSTVASTTVTLSILIMVVLGGAGTRWGAVVGAMGYYYLQELLVKVASQPSFTTLPTPLRVPLSQPQFLLGAIFVVFVVFAPAGVAGLVHRGGRKGPTAWSVVRRASAAARPARDE